MDKIEQAFIKFKDTHYKAVEADVRLGDCDIDSDKYPTLRKRSRQRWAESQIAEAELMALIIR